MNLLIQSTLHTLQKSKFLLQLLSNDELSNSSVSPYYSSIGTHLRHIFDFYNCILNEKANRVDLTDRERNTNIESYCDFAECCLDDLIIKFNNSTFEFEKEIIVVDDLGLGKIEIKYTFGSLLAQANSHTIHHYAIINYILDGLNIEIQDSDFGYNPTTPKTTLN